jgi:recombination protein RecA
MATDKQVQVEERGAAKPTGASRDKILDSTVALIEKQYGKGSIMRLSGDAHPSKVPVIPTGSTSLDIALGVGGFPKGRVVEIYGHESSGKTSLALHAIAECQKRGGVAAFIDAEHALDVHYARKLGVNIDELLVSQPDYGEQALEIADLLTRSNAVDIIVLDSVAALVPKAEIEGEMGDSFVGLQARLMSQALRKLTGSLNRSHTCMIFLNQIRMKIGVMYGNPETTSGGNALKFYASVRCEIRRSQVLKDKDGAQYGIKCKVKIVKNKIAPPFRETEFDMLNNEGIDSYMDLVDSATTMGLVNKSGSWYSLGDERIGQGRDAVKDYLKEHPATFERLLTSVRSACGFDAAPEAEPAAQG